MFTQFSAMNLNSTNVSPAEFQVGDVDQRPRQSHGSFINNPRGTRNARSPFEMPNRANNQFLQRGMAASSVSDFVLQRQDFRTCKMSGQKKTLYCQSCSYIHCTECVKDQPQCNTQEMHQDELAYLDMLGEAERKYTRCCFERLDRLDLNQLRMDKEQK